MGIQYSHIISDFVLAISMVRIAVRVLVAPGAMQCPQCFTNNLKVKNLSYDKFKLVTLPVTNDEFRVVK